MVYSSTTYKFTTSGQKNAEAFITKSKNRLKQNGGTVYLKDGDNFEIELFNPRMNNVLAKIKINGTYLTGGGLVLKPGQRYHLERYIDSTQKFLFSTYEIDGTDQAAVNAISNNGLVEVEFYDEVDNKPPSVFTISNGIGSEPWNRPWFERYDKYNPLKNFFTTSIDNSMLFNSSSNTFSNTVVGATTSDYKSNVRLNSLSTDTTTSKSLETGRIEKGEHSNQSFKTVDMEFQSLPCTTICWHIQPESVKPVETSELKKYCTQCGSKLKPAHKFCPNCGTKVED